VTAPHVDALLPCPFCGADGELTHGGHGEMLVRCSAIPCSAGLGGNCWQTTEKGAYEAWNRRTPAAHAELAAVREGTIEECAKVCDKGAESEDGQFASAYRWAAEEIRALAASQAGGK
jgi:ssDNA-binding Zn-finger/Zn-ribbon topoisomerase 1